MKFSDLEKLVAEHGDEIIDALREADHDAYRNPHLKFSVALYADGTTEERYEVAGSNSWYANDAAVAEFGDFCHQYFSPMWDGFNNSNEMLNELLRVATPEERKQFDAWRNETTLEEKLLWDDPDGNDEDYAPEPNESCRWIEENLTDLWDRVEETAIDWLTDYADYDEIIDSELDRIRDYEIYAD